MMASDSASRAQEGAAIPMIHGLDRHLGHSTFSEKTASLPISRRSRTHR